MLTILVRHRAALVCLGLAIALGGCASVGPDYHVPASAVAARAPAAAPFLGSAEAAFRPAPLPAHWWRLYDDPVLDRLVPEALAANTDLRVAAANLARTRAVAQELGQAGKPLLGVSAAPALGRASGAAKGSAAALADVWSYDAGISVSYQADLFGKLARAVEAANADTQAAQAALELARISVAADTARAYADACAAGRQIALARQSVQLQQRLLALTRQRIGAGRGSALDLARARSQLAQLQAGLPPLQAQQGVARLRLAALRGLTPAEMAPGALACQAAPRLRTPIPVGDGAALLRRRPDVRQAERALAAATARIGVATADLYPSISLGLSAGSNGLLDHAGAGNSLRWSLGPLISWTLPSTGTAHARIAQAEAGSDAALAHFDAVVLSALKEVESALTVLARELDRNAALATAHQQSALASQQAQRLYRYGRIDFFTVLDADRSLAASSAAWAVSDAQLANDQIALFLALGGGWQKADESAGANAGVTADVTAGVTADDSADAPVATAGAAAPALATPAPARAGKARRVR